MSDLGKAYLASLPPIRAHLLAGALLFVQAAGALPGVSRIALIGSLTTSKASPKDIDLLVTVADDADLTQLAALGEKLFWQRPTLAGYEELRAPAQAQRRWDDLRGGILRRLARDGQHVLLTEIALREGDVQAALAALAKVKEEIHGPAPAFTD